MSWYRRWRECGGVYFFTLTAYERRPILTTPAARTLLREAIRQTRRERPFNLLAVVLLPDHLHCIWALPASDSDYSTRWRLIKSRFTQALMASGYGEPEPNASRRKRFEHTVWQRRYWEHLVRDEDDWKRHLDYIHYNPVKHGYVASPNLWPYSSFTKYARLGEYEVGWGASEPETIRMMESPEAAIELPSE